MPVLMFHGLNDTALNAEGLSGTWNWLEKDLTLVTVPGAGPLRPARRGRDGQHHDAVVADDADRRQVGA